MSPTDFHPNLKLLSHSSIELFHTCPRKYELYKLGAASRDENEDTRFGHVVGIGVQHLLVSGDRDRSILAAMLRWPDELDNDDGRPKKKTFWHAIHAVDSFVQLRNTFFGNYEVAIFDGKPAVELGFQIDFGDGFYYRGFLDALLYNRITRQFLVYEGKTTKFKQVSEAMYKHSAQSVGYSVVIDTLAHRLGIPLASSYEVCYSIWKTGGGDGAIKGEWETMKFKKSHTHRALWLKNVLLDKERIIQYGTEGFFPMYGENCYDFFRECEHFGTCEMSNRVLAPNPEVNQEPAEKYPFKYNLADIIEAQIAKGEAT